MLGGVIILLLIGISLFADALAPYPYNKTHLRDRSYIYSFREFSGIIKAFGLFVALLPLVPTTPLPQRL